MKKRHIPYKIIPIPHLRYKVVIDDLSVLQGEKIKGSAFTCISGEYEATILIKDIEETLKHKENYILVAHEVMHVIQILCETFNMKIEEEQEHTAYLLVYLIDEIFKGQPNK